MSEQPKLIKEDVERAISEWYATHVTKPVIVEGHRVDVCVNCEWPPALDGRCRCDWERLGTDV